MQKRRFLSLTVHNVYVILTALQLILVPNMLLNMFGFEETNEVWIRVLGFVVLSLPFMYNAINKEGNYSLVKSTVLARFLVGSGFILLALTQDKSNLILFGLLDLGTAVWTWTELKKYKF